MNRTTTSASIALLLLVASAQAQFAVGLKNVEFHLGPNFVDKTVLADGSVALALGLGTEFGSWNDFSTYFHFDYWWDSDETKEFVGYNGYIPVYSTTDNKTSEINLSLGVKRELKLALPFTSYFLMGGGLSLYSYDFASDDDTETDFSLHLAYEADYKISDELMAFARIKKSTNGGNYLGLQVGVSYLIK